MQQPQAIKTSNLQRWLVRSVWALAFLLVTNVTHYWLVGMTGGHPLIVAANEWFYSLAFMSRLLAVGVVSLTMFASLTHVGGNRFLMAVLFSVAGAGLLLGDFSTLASPPAPFAGATGWGAARSAVIGLTGLLQGLFFAHLSASLGLAAHRQVFTAAAGLAAVSGLLSQLSLIGITTPVGIARSALLLASVVSLFALVSLAVELRPASRGRRDARTKSAEQGSIRLVGIVVGCWALALLGWWRWSPYVVCAVALGVASVTVVLMSNPPSREPTNIFWRVLCGLLAAALVAIAVWRFRLGTWPWWPDEEREFMVALALLAPTSSLLIGWPRLAQGNRARWLLAATTTALLVLVAILSHGEPSWLTFTRAVALVSVLLAQAYGIAILVHELGVAQSDRAKLEDAFE